MKCYNKNCPDHGEFDSCKRNCTDICGSIQTKPNQSLGISTKIEVPNGLNAEEPIRKVIDILDVAYQKSLTLTNYLKQMIEERNKE